MKRQKRPSPVSTFAIVVPMVYACLIGSSLLIDRPVEWTKYAIAALIVGISAGFVVLYLPQSP